MGLFGGGGGGLQPPQAAPVPPTITDPSVVQAQQDLVREQAEAKGRASTILTSGAGDTSPPQNNRKTLLGS